MLAISWLYLVVEVEGIFLDDVGGNGVGVSVGDGEAEMTSFLPYDLWRHAFLQKIRDICMAKWVEGQDLWKF